MVETTEGSTELSDNIGEQMDPATKTPTKLDKLQSLLTKSGKNRNAHLRKEQLSQGVLSTLLRSLGRLVEEQVTDNTKQIKIVT
jgi:hypothetical protein